MTDSVKVGAEAIATKGWVKAHQWLILRRLSQLSILGLFMISRCWLIVWKGRHGWSRATWPPA